MHWPQLDTVDAFLYAGSLTALCFFGICCGKVLVLAIFGK